MTHKTRQPGILARIIRDIPTFGGDVKRGTLLIVAEQNEDNRHILDCLMCPTTGEMRVCCARRGQEFEIVEAVEAKPKTAMSSINDI